VLLRRTAALGRFRDEHGWGENCWELQNLVASLNADEGGAGGRPGRAPARGAPRVATPDVEDFELDYGDGDPTEDQDSELLTA